MQKTVLIATTRVPTQEVHFTDICQDLRRIGADDGLVLNGVHWCEGPGCSNLALDFDGDKTIIEKFANDLTMQVQPAKWSYTSERVYDDCCNLNGLKVNVPEIEVGDNL